MTLAELNANKTNLQNKWSNDTIYREKINLELNFTKSETSECLLENVDDYISNFNKSMSKGDLETKLKKNFRKDDYDNDLSFGCFSVGLDFNFEISTNV